MLQPKVLIACPVNSIKQYCITDYLDRIIQLTYLNKNYYFVDNSDDRLWHIDNVIEHGFDCDYVAPLDRRNNVILCECQNKIRDKVLREGYDYLFFLECDIFPPLTIIEQLLAYETDIVACNYFVAQGEDSLLLKTEIEDSFGEITNREINWLEGFLEYGTGKTKSRQHGFGCVLIHRSILDQVEFVVDDSIKAHSDTHFYFRLAELGIDVTVHDIIVEHRNSSWKNVVNL